MKLHDSIHLGGKHLLSMSETGKLHNYCGSAIRRSVNSLEVMKIAVWAIFFSQVVQNDKASMYFAQVMMTFGVNSRAMPAQELHMNINILYQLLLQTQSSYYSRNWLLYIFMGKLRMPVFELSNLDMDTQNCYCMAQYTQEWGT